MTRHPDLPTLTDFARGIPEGAARTSVDRHLDSGCSRCAGIVESFRRVVADAQTLEQLSPPAWAERSVRALAGLGDRATGRSSWLTLTLAFDSALAPAAAGVRGGHGSARELLFRSAEYAVEMRIDRAAETAGGALSGQLVRLPDEPVVEAPVHLVADGRLAGTGLTDSFGSFHLDRRDSGPIELRLLVDDDRALRIVLDESASGAGR